MFHRHAGPSHDNQCERAEGDKSSLARSIHFGNLAGRSFASPIAYARRRQTAKVTGGGASGGKVSGMSSGPGSRMTSGPGARMSGGGSDFGAS